MRALLTVAKMTWTELLRDRLVTLIGFVAAFLLALTVFLGSLTLDEQLRLIVHLGFASFQLTLVCMALFLGSWTLQRELDRQTCLLVLSRPVSRTQFLIGKYLGALAMVTFFWLILGVLHLLLLDFHAGIANYFIVYATIWVEAAFLLALCFFFASFMKPFLALASGFSLWLAGHWREDLVFFAKKSKSPLFLVLSDLSAWIFPPLAQIQVRTLGFLENPNPDLLWIPCLSLFFWSTLSLFLAQLVFGRKDLV